MEDNEINQQVAMEKLEKIDMTVDLAINDVEAVKSAGNKNHDVIPMENLPNSLPGLDLEKGIKNLDNNTNLYRKLLNIFRRDHEDTVKKAKAAIAAGRFKDARLISHTIKGVAGNIGAFGLQNAASLLDEAIALNNSSNLDALFNDFSIHMQRVMESIKKLPLEKEQRSSTPVNKEVIIPKLAELNKLLEDNNFEAISLFTEIKSELQVPGLISNLKRLEKSIETLAFDRAREELAVIQQKIDGKNPAIHLRRDSH